MAVQLIAHRGASAYALENTMEAFALAHAQGADGIELDVQLTADGQLVVFHDDDLMRLAQRPETVREIPFTRLAQMPLAHREFRGSMPRLQDVFAWAEAHRLSLNVELKLTRSRDAWPMACAFAELAAQSSRDLCDRVLVSSFAPSALVAMRVRAPNVSRAFLFDREHTGVFRARAAAAIVPIQRVHPHHSLVTPRRMARWRREKRIVNAWTVDAVETARRLASLAVDGIITNDVPKLRAALLS